MKPTQELVDAIYAEKVRRARQMTFEQKFLAGAELFDFACRFAEAGIRKQFPDADGRKVRSELRRRLRIGRMLENQTASSSAGESQ